MVRPRRTGVQLHERLALAACGEGIEGLMQYQLTCGEQGPERQLTPGQPGDREKQERNEGRGENRCRQVAAAQQVAAGGEPNGYSSENQGADQAQRTIASYLALLFRNKWLALQPVPKPGTGAGETSRHPVPGGRCSWVEESMAGDPAVAGQTREKGGLLDGRKWDYEPLAAIKFHIRIRGAPCVGFFSCHVDLPFLLSREAITWC